jgi:hypothetical protein
MRGLYLTDPDMENGRHNLQIHIKFAGDWLTMAEMGNVHNEELLGAIVHLTKKLIAGMEPFYQGEGLGKMQAGKLDKNGMLTGEFAEE